MRKPNLFIIGPPRSGTTSLHKYLSEHPYIFMSKHKEPEFFSDFKNDLSIKELEVYIAHKIINFNNKSNKTSLKG